MVIVPIFILALAVDWNSKNVSKVMAKKIIFCFMFVIVLGIRKGVNHPMLIPSVWYRQVTMQLNKQWNNPRPSGHEPPVSLFSVAKFGGFDRMENKSQKLKILKSQSDGGFAHVPYYLVNNCVLISPVLGAQHLVPSNVIPPYCIVAMS